jgi:WD40 repeat protein
MPRESDGRLVSDVNAVAFSPDAKILFAEDGLWSTTGGEHLGRLQADPTFDDTLALSRDGSTVATADDLGEVRLFDVRTRRGKGEPLLSYPHPFTTVAYSPDARTVAAGDLDGKIGLWDAATQTQLAAPLEIRDGGAAVQACSDIHCGDDYVTGLAFSADGETIAAAND